MADWINRKAFSRTSFYNASSNRINSKCKPSDDQINLRTENDFEKDFAATLQDLQTDTNDKSIQRLYDLVKILFNTKTSTGICKTIIESKLRTNSNLICKSLISSWGHSSKSRVLSLKLINTLNHVPYFNQEFLAMNIHCHLKRLVANHLKSEHETEFCLLIEYTRLIRSLYSSQIAEVHIFILLKIFKSLNHQQLDMICLETLLELAYARPTLAAKCGCITELLKFILVKLPDDLIIENTMLVIFKMLSFAECRHFGLVGNVFNFFLAPFIDTQAYIPHADLNENLVKSSEDPSKLDKILNACKQVLIATFSNFVGFLCFKSNELNITSLLTTFRVLNFKAIKYLLDVFNNIFSIDSEAIPNPKDYTKESDIVNSEFHCFLSLIRDHGPKSSGDPYKLHLLKYFIDNLLFDALAYLLENLKVSKDQSETMHDLFRNCLNLTAQLWLLADEYNLLERFSDSIIQPVISIDNDTATDISALILKHLDNGLKPTDTLKFSFFFQKFLTINSEIKLQDKSILIEPSISTELLSNKKEWKKYEQILNEQIEATNILSTSKNSGTKLECAQAWKWLEIVRLFKNYLSPSNDDVSLISILGSTQPAASNLKKTLKNLLVNLVDFYTDIDMNLSIGHLRVGYKSEIENFVINVGYYLIDILVDYCDVDPSQTIDYLLRLYLNNVKSFLYSEINSNYSIASKNSDQYDDEDNKLHFYIICLYIGHLSCTVKGMWFESFEVWTIFIKYWPCNFI
jgi:hypothetical protein